MATPAYDDAAAPAAVADVGGGMWAATSELRGLYRDPWADHAHDYLPAGRFPSHRDHAG